MKKSTQTKIKVTPTSNVVESKAPYYVIDVNSSSRIEEQKKEAIEEAKKLSRLSDAKNFTFKAERL